MFPSKRRWLWIEPRRSLVGPAKGRGGFTLIELLVVLAIVGVVVGMAVTAVQKFREAASRVQCLNHLKQLGHALSGYHDVYGTFPHAYDARALFIDPSMTPETPAHDRWILTRSWATLLLAFLEQENLERSGYAFYHERHVPIFVCPSDRRATAFYSRNDQFGQQALTDYLAVTGTKTFLRDPQVPAARRRCDGVIYESSRTRLADITDGASNTVLVGERPPSQDLFWGWWTWSAFDASLGVQNDYPVYGTSGDQPPTVCFRLFPESYRPSDNNNCDTHHFWSAHPSGGNWLFADGSARFLPYSAKAIVPALATRAGGEVMQEYD